MPRILLKERGAFGNADTGGAWLSSAHALKMIQQDTNQDPRLKTEDDLTDDALKKHEADIEAIDFILISIPNDIYNSVDSCQTTQEKWLRVKRLMQGSEMYEVDRDKRFNNEFDQFTAELGESLVSVKYVNHVRLAKDLTKRPYDELFDYLQQYEKLVIASRVKKLEKTHDPIALVSHIGSSSRSLAAYYVSHPPSVVDYDDEYQGDTLQNDPEDSLTSAMMLLSRAITQLTRRSCNVQKNPLRVEIEKGHYARNSPNSRVWDSKYIMKQMLLAKKDEVRVILSNEQNDFLIADVAQMDEIRELSANICMMAKIHLANMDSIERPNYDSAFISEVQAPSTSYLNPLFSNSFHEQTYHEQPKIINSRIDDDQINNDILFDDPTVEVNSDNVEHDKNDHDSHDNELEQLARNAYKEAEKQQIIAQMVK
ncbi:hypothetical protein Tco_1032211 [Tanacetum coccineum]|uniref:Gag-Pol polyprotein n=1 Tax=Tanacetum coccineum TaxID=301880 RepID=A0ABQ5GBR5_9ASTR